VIREIHTERALWVELALDKALSREAHGVAIYWRYMKLHLISAVLRCL
jgi:hypothetical protein